MAYADLIPTRVPAHLPFSLCRHASLDVKTGATELVNLSGSVSSSGGVSSTVDRTAGAATRALDESATVGAQVFATLMQYFLTEAAQKGWESGRCVRLDVKAEPGRKDVQPGGTSDITAAPRSKVDGARPVAT